MRVKCPFVREDEDMLISSIDYTLDGGGTVCAMTLYSPTAFDMLPEIPEPDAGAGALSGARALTAAVAEVLVGGAAGGAVAPAARSAPNGS